MRLEHVGIAVDDLDEVVQTLERFMGRGPYKSERVESEGVETVFIDGGGVKIELLRAISHDSPIAKFLEKRGRGLHHLAFEVDDIEAAHIRLTSAGFKVLAAEPVTGADGKRIFFVHPGDTAGVLLECCERDPNAGGPLYAAERSDKSRETYFRPESCDLLIVHVDFDAVLAREIGLALEPSRSIGLLELVNDKAAGRDHHLNSARPPRRVLWLRSALSLVENPGNDAVLIGRYSEVGESILNQTGDFEGLIILESAEGLDRFREERARNLAIVPSRIDEDAASFAAAVALIRGR